MNTALTVDDPLADQEVNIVITLTACSKPRDERPALVSVGVAEQLPVIKTGVFDNIATLINEAWMAFGVRAQVVTAAVPDVETVAEEQVVATATAGDDESAPMLSANLSTPKPQAKNLSLF